jgi:Tol biopolymer transport system component
MIDERFVRVSERFQPPPGGFERLHARRGRRLRNRRIGTAALSIVVAVAALGLAFRAFGDRAVTPAASDRFAGVHGWIAYGGLGVVAIDPSDPSHRASLDEAQVVEAPLVWAPDGSRLLIARFTSGTTKDGAVDLVVLNADGSESRLASDGVIWGGASFSPDGAEIVYSAIDKSIRIVSVSGGPARMIYDGRADGWYPQVAWSPDGSTIAYTTFPAPDGPFLWLMDPDGSNRRRVADLSVGAHSFGGGGRGLQWSPDGKELAFVLQAGANHGELFTIRADGSDETRLTESGPMTWNGSPTWSPDGSHLAFMTNYLRQHKDQPNSIGVVNQDGTGLQVLFEGPNQGPSGFVAWNPLAPVAANGSSPA